MNKMEEVLKDVLMRLWLSVSKPDEACKDARQESILDFLHKYKHLYEGTLWKKS